MTFIAASLFDCAPSVARRARQGNSSGDSLIHPFILTVGVSALHMFRAASRFNAEAFIPILDLCINGMNRRHAQPAFRRRERMFRKFWKVIGQCGY
jgi:hypothetical protein